MTFHAHFFRMTLGLCGLALLMPNVATRAQNPNSAPQESTAQARKFKIAGTAVNAVTGAPLSEARISIAETKNRGQVNSLMTTENGHFEFSHLEAGKYSLQGAKRGFIPAAFEQHEQFSTAIVTGPEYATENLILSLTPMALIAGHVFDENGDPVRSARVFLYLEDHRGGLSRITRHGSASSDDRGFYDFSLLRPGKYFISVSAKPWYAVHPATANDGSGKPSQPTVSPALDVVYPTTYYNGATEADAATPIEVKGGDRVQIEVHLNPVAALHLTFRVPNDKPDRMSWPMLEKRVFDAVEFEQPGNMQRVGPGVYELTGIAPGHYTLRLRNETGKLEPGGDVDLSRNGQEMDTSRGEPLGSLALTLKMSGEEPFPKEYSAYLLDSRRRVVGFKQGDPSGQFLLEDLPPGKYGIFIAAPKLYSVIRTSSSAGETAGHEVNITPGAALELTAALRAGLVSIEGVVHKKEQPVAGVMVALVPKDPAAHIELFRRDQSDFDGTFVLHGVIPGRYTIVAVEDAWGFEWNNPDVLARYVQHGQELTIGELMRGSVHLPDPVEVQPQ